MNTDRKMSELEDTPVSEWTLEELAYHHDAMSQMAGLLNAEGVSIHHSIINEIERRGGLKGLRNS